MIEFINFIILFGAVQGFILAFILIFNKKNKHQGRYFLGIFILILVYNGFETYNWSVGWNYHFFDYTSFILVFGIGPSIYWYVKSFTCPEKISFQVVFKHYFPVVIQFFIKTTLVLYLLLSKNQEAVQFWGRLHALISEPLSVVLSAIYIGLAWKVFNQFILCETTIYSSEEKRLIINWLRIFLVFLSLLTAMWAVSVVAQYFFTGFISFSFYYPTEVLLAIMVYWIGFTGFHQIRTVYVAANKIHSSFNDLSEQEIKDCIVALEKAMETDKVYLDPELNLTKLSAHLQISPKTISAVLNQQLKKGFNEFINGYRIEIVKQKLLKSENQHLTISGIALESGFNSQATFQRVFKVQTGLSPKEFLASERQ